MPLKTISKDLVVTAVEQAPRRGSTYRQMPTTLKIRLRPTVATRRDFATRGAGGLSSQQAIVGFYFDPQPKNRPARESEPSGILRSLPSSRVGPMLVGNDVLEGFEDIGRPSLGSGVRPA